MGLIYHALTAGYAKFSGRSRRKEYWLFFCFCLFVSVFFGFFEVSILLLTDQFWLDIITTIMNLALFIPWSAVSVRRLHDINLSGWFYLLSLLPFLWQLQYSSMLQRMELDFSTIQIDIMYMLAGPVILFVLALLPGTQGANKFGEDPLNSGY